MKRTTHYDLWGAAEGVDPEALRAQDRQRSKYLWNLSTWLQQRGYVSPQDAADTKSAVAAGALDIELAGNASPERLKEAANIYQSCFPREMATVQRAMGWGQAQPNDDDRRLRQMTEDESQNAAAILWTARNRPDLLGEETFRAAKDELARLDSTKPTSEPIASDFSESQMSEFVRSREVEEAKTTISDSGYAPGKAVSGHSLIREPVESKDASK